jgi:hypothetical protein
LDYQDVARLYWQIMGFQKNFLFTSTAIPVGEEFRILRFADGLLRGYEQNGLSLYNALRVSLTNRNYARAGAISAVLSGLHTDFAPGKERYIKNVAVGFCITDNRDDDPIPFGNKWNLNGTDIEICDMIGLNCKDDVWIGVHAIENTYMGGISNEWPTGRMVFPVAGTDAKGNRQYTVVHHYNDPYNMKNADVHHLYPDPPMTKITIHGKQVNKKIETIKDDPHRLLSRLVAGLEYFGSKYDKEWQQFTKSEKDEYRKTFSREIRIIRNYLNETNNNNRSMTKVLRFIFDE